MATRTILFAAALAAALSHSACTEGAPEPHLITADAATPPGGDPLQFLRDQQLLVYYQDGERHEEPYFEIEDAVDDHCDGLFEQQGPSRSTCAIDNSAQSDCQDLHCQVEHIMCKAHLYIDIALNEGQDIHLTPWATDGSDVRLPVQSVATSSFLLEVAQYHLVLITYGIVGGPNTSSSAFDNLKSEPEYCVDTDGNLETLQDEQGRFLTLPRSFATHLGEALELTQEIDDTMIPRYVALADAQYSTERDLSVAAQRAMLIRMHAAHLLTGGRLTDWRQQHFRPFCTEPSLRRGAARALRLIRQSGVDPDRIVDSDTSIVALLDDPGGVRERLAALWEQEEVYGSNTVDGGVELTPLADALAAWDVTTDDFVAARKYIKDEFQAYDRDLDVSQEHSAGAGTPSLYGATRTPPVPPPQAYYTGLLKRPKQSTESATWLPDLFGDLDPALAAANGFPLGLRNLTGSIALSAAEALKGIEAFPEAIAEEIQGPLALTAANNVSEIDGVIFWEVVPTESSTQDGGTGDAGGQDGGDMNTADGIHARFDVHHSPRTAAADYYGVTSLRDLKCAVSGEIEGVPCDWPAEALTPESVDDSASPRHTFDQIARFYFDGYVPEEFYVVKRKPGGVDKQTGDYRDVYGMYIGDLEENFYDYSTFPEVLNRRYDERAAALLTPGKTWCTQPKTSCAGTDFDEAVPLENEITDDGDAFENSWRHYLNLAKQAADEADLLGEEVIRQGLQMDGQSEDALAEIEDICGAAISIDTLTDENAGSLEACSCTTSGCTCADPEESCVGGVCIRDPLQVAGNTGAELPELNRLYRCLGSSELHDFVALGDMDLCLWHADGDRNRICETPDDAGDYSPCPGEAIPPAPGETPTCEHIQSPADTSVMQVNEKLGIFSPNDHELPIVVPRSVGSLPCEDLRKIRDYPSGDMPLFAWMRVVASGFFQMSNLQNIGPRISFKAEPYGFGTIYLDGKPWISTGNMTVGPNQEWPCGDSPPEGCPSLSNSLRCLYNVNCDQASWRYFHTGRLARAATAARWLSGADLRNMFYPIDTTEFSQFGLFGATYMSTFTGQELATSNAIAHFMWGELDDMQGYCISSWATSDETLWNSDSGDEYGHGCSDGYPFIIAEWGEYGDSNTADANRRRAAELLRDAISGNPWYEDAHPFEAALENERMSVGGPMWGKTDGDGSAAARDGNNAASMAPERGRRSVQGQAFLDGLELLCKAAENPGRSKYNCQKEPPEIRSERDIPNAARYLECVAKDLEWRASTTVFAQFPKAAFDALREDSGAGSFPAIGGQLGSETSRLRQHMIEVATVPALIADEIRNLGTDMENLKIALALAENSGELAQINFRSKVVNHVSACAGAMASLSGAGTAMNPGNAAAAAITCANSVAQIAFAAQTHKIEEENAELNEDSALVAFQERLNSRASALRLLGFRLADAVEGVDGSLDQIEILRRRGRRALARSLFMESDSAGRLFRTNSVIRRRFDVNKHRYDRARDDAVRLAFLAKRAIEQRFGVNLAELDEGMTLVDAPASWQGDVCVLSGIDYERIADAGFEVESYSKGYAGDYVRNLEKFVESYRLDYPFSSGADVGVFSMRDDIMNVRDFCEAEAHNLLYSSGNLAQAGDRDLGRRGWQALGCSTDGSGQPLGDCAVAMQLTADPMLDATSGEPTLPVWEGPADLPMSTWAPELGVLKPFRVAFGPRLREACTEDAFGGLSTACSGETDCCLCGSGCGLSAESRWSQTVELSPGVYRLSWYGREVDSANGDYPDPGPSVRVLSPTTGATTAEYDGAVLHSEPADNAWVRYWRTFGVPGAAEVEVAVVNAASDGSRLTLPRALDLAGLMLEDVTGVVPHGSDGSGYPPKRFVATGFERERRLPVCEDTDGDVFRAGWRRGCSRLCGDGFGASCGSEAAEKYCYWETEFTIDPRSIERGDVFGLGGFARGNYNYRVDSIGLNFVGSVRDCADSTTGSTCYSSAYVPYSIEHLGPHTFRNHWGAEFDAAVHTGRIEFGRGLASGRYLTNPISGADRALMQDFMRHEMRGRPLTGTYRVRVWDDPGVVFDELEDVQVLLNYRYWTRNQ